ncbi:hypothetical protein DYB37_013386 [Aphanomyces astaci]|uniref:HTH CENPB-type domain-containing protein n=1 Tax=Aphanomyces astaci TaxID=112090 RepID=A0A3R7AX30_APHAT|nr:hypothetical protein DYB35_013837 [Aphanomyces astaci]RHZ07185.1 hypothetical protein DYB37_013386 [Aphanomyces astaci]
MESAISTFFKGASESERKSIWKQILRWEAQRKHITAAATKPSTSQHRTTRLRDIATTLTTSDEEQIAEWVAELRKDGIPVSNLLLECKAMEVAAEKGLSTIQFKASPSWRKRFMKSWGLAIRAKARSGQANLEDGEKALEAFKTSIRDIIRENDIEEVFNADQTGINYEYLPKKTICKTGAKTIWITCSGHEKDRMTAMVLADAKGTKYPLCLVLKTKASTVKSVLQKNLTERHGFGKRVWTEIQEIEDNYPLQVYGNPSAWWNSGISVHFLKYHFGSRRGQTVKKVLLLWDYFSAHFTVEVEACAKELSVVLARVPPTFTCMCQPADVAWMKPIKAVMRRKWVDFLRTQIANNGSGGGKSFQLRSPDRWDLVDWVYDAWESLSTATIIRGFIKCKIID